MSDPSSDSDMCLRGPVQGVCMYVCMYVQYVGKTLS